MGTIITLVRLLIESVVELIQLLFDLLFTKDHSYKGAFGKKKKVLAKEHKENGIAIGNQFIDLKTSLAGGMMLLARTGMGKSSKIFKNNLFGAQKTKASYINLDVSGELRNDCGAFMVEKLGYTEEILNFSDSTKATVTWNPIANLKEEQINRFANDFVSINMNSDPKDPIWNLMSSSLLSISIRLLKRIDLKQYINMYNVRNIISKLQAEPKKIDVLISYYADAYLYQDYKAFLNNEERFLNSVLSNTLACLQQFEDPNIIKTTSTNTLDMESYREGKKVLYLQNDVMAQSYLASLNSLFFTQWFSYITAQGIPEEDKQTIVFAIDEASSLKMKKDILPLVVSQIRKYKSFGIFGYQTYNQVIDLLGLQGAQTLKQNTGTVLYMGDQNLDTARELSSSLGRYSYKSKEQEKTREVLTVEEAMYLDDCKEGGLLCVGHHRPIKMKKIKAFYEIPEYKKWSEQEAPEITPISQDLPPLLPIDDFINKIMLKSNNEVSL